MSAQLFSAIVVTFRTGPILRDCLAALQRDPDLGEILVIDNGNPAQDRLWLEDEARRDARLIVIRPGRNLGFSAACNLGAAKARGSFIAFVNPDMIVPTGAFAALPPIFAARKDVWMCGGRLTNADGSEQRGSRREVLTPWRAFVELMRLDRLAPEHPYFRRFHLLDQPPEADIIEVPAISGAFMALPRERFLALGGLDEGMFLHTEDLDLCLRILLAGGKIVYCGTLSLYHQRSTSDVSTTFVEWHKARSTCRYFHKHFRNTYPLWCLRLISVLLWIRFLLVILPATPADLRRLFRGERL